MKIYAQVIVVLILLPAIIPLSMGIVFSALAITQAHYRYVVGISRGYGISSDTMPSSGGVLLNTTVADLMCESYQNYSISSCLRYIDPSKLRLALSVMVYLEWRQHEALNPNATCVGSINVGGKYVVKYVLTPASADYVIVKGNNVVVNTVSSGRTKGIYVEFRNVDVRDGIVVNVTELRNVQPQHNIYLSVDTTLLLDTAPPVHVIYILGSILATTVSIAAASIITERRQLKELQI